MDPIIPIISIIILVFSVILHEVAHGFVADKLGDPTARLKGRLTLNPLPHIDPIFSLIIPAMLILSGSPVVFGAAKPVPINPMNFKDFKKDIALTALAGPLTNICLALLFAVAFNLFPSPLLISGITMNLSLAFLNLVPIPPIDGSKILVAFLPSEFISRYLSLEPYGLILLLFLLYMPFGGIGLGDIIGRLLRVSLQILGIPL